VFLTLIVYHRTFVGKFGTSSTRFVGQTCDDQRLVYHTERPLLHTARCRYARSSATVDDSLTNAEVRISGKFWPRYRGQKFGLVWPWFQTLDLSASKWWLRFGLKPIRKKFNLLIYTGHLIIVVMTWPPSLYSVQYCLGLWVKLHVCCKK